MGWQEPAEGMVSPGFPSGRRTPEMMRHLRANTGGLQFGFLFKPLIYDCLRIKWRALLIGILKVGTHLKSFFPPIAFWDKSIRYQDEGHSWLFISHSRGKKVLLVLKFSTSFLWASLEDLWLENIWRYVERWALLLQDISLPKPKNTAALEEHIKSLKY